MKKTKHKNLRRAIGFVMMVALVGGLAAMPLLAARNAPQEEFPRSILSETAQVREIALNLRSGGVLAEEEGTSVTVPADVKLTEFLVKNGDYVRQGDPIALVDRVTVMTAIASTQEAMVTLAQQLEEERTGSSTDTIKVPGGLVKKVYAKAGDSAEDVMLQHGALATLSLDGLMKLELTLDSGFTGGESLQVQIGDQTLDATVKSNLEGVLTVTFQDKGFEEGQEALLLTGEGTVLGSGKCVIHAPWNAVAYSGTVSYVSVTEGRTLYENGTVLGLKDIPYSAAYRSLAAQHREYERQLLELFGLYQTLTVTAPADGIVSGVDEDSAQLLSSRGSWSVTLLKNAPGADPDGEYINFVGWVKEQGSDGYIVALDPTLFSLTDYSDLSSLSRNTDSMTSEAVYAGGAPVYRWNGDGWTESSFAVGDLLLFGGDAGGNVVWVIPYGHVEVSGEDPTEPSEPSDPTDPTGPTEPGEPDDPTGPTEPADPSQPSDPTVPGGSGSRPGGSGSLPSFGGYGAYSGANTQQEESYSISEAEIALVIPQETMTLEVFVDELDLSKVQLGRQAEITLEALSGTFFGTVTAIGRSGESNGGSSKFTVTLTLPRGEDMLPGMNAAVNIPLETVRGIAVSVAAVQSSQGKNFVYTALDAKTGEPVSPVDVTASRSDGEYVLVEGLAEGTEVYYSYYEALEE